MTIFCLLAIAALHFADWAPRGAPRSLSIFGFHCCTAGMQVLTTCLLHSNPPISEVRPAGTVALVEPRLLQFADQRGNKRDVTPDFAREPARFIIGRVLVQIEPARTVG